MHCYNCGLSGGVAKGAVGVMGPRQHLLGDGKLLIKN